MPCPWEGPLHQPLPQRTAAPRLEDFKIRTPEIVRFGDMDRQGHVNNAVYSTYLETGRVAVIFNPDQGLQVAGSTTVLARIQIDFLKELRWPARSRWVPRSLKSEAVRTYSRRASSAM